MIKFAHLNFNVIDLEKSLKFYNDALGLKERNRTVPDNGSFIIVYLTDGITPFLLELTWLSDWDKPNYDLGDAEFHLAVETDEYDTLHALHEKMGCICFENPAMGVYFINDPDGYWIEITKAD